MKKILPWSLLTLLTLSACTGTVEQSPAIVLSVLSGGGERLQTVLVGGPSPDSTVPIRPGASQAVPASTELLTLVSERQLALVTREAVEARSAELAVTRRFTAPPLPPAGARQP
ncbi:hypothetical protein ACFP81_10340 [Deinococcus lacus]|uniref:Uncharacterized protein n=1 Tax=Deinococcus lacus TaxID=392561 RepID=A0ABW1YEA7_9DEIO